MRFFGTWIRKKYIRSAVFLRKVRHIPANLCFRVDDMASDQGEISVLFFGIMYTKFYRES